MVKGVTKPHAPSRGELDSGAKLLIATANVGYGKPGDIHDEVFWQNLRARVRALMANSHIVVLTSVSDFWWMRICIDIHWNAATVLKRGDWDYR